MGAAAADAVVWLIFNCVLWCKWKQIKIAIAVIDATADFFVTTKRINLVSVGYFFLMMMWVAFWATCMVFMLSIAEYDWDPSPTNTTNQRRTVKQDS